jgi:Flp pilus assembly protein TadB
LKEDHAQEGVSLTDKKATIKQEAEKRFTDSLKKFRKRREREQKQKKWTRVFFICFAFFFVAFCVYALAIGKPIIILASFVPVVIVWAMGGLTSKDLLFLIWWDIGKKK